MARYEINYLGGETQEIDATRIEHYEDQYIGWSDDGTPIAYVPVDNVRSIIRMSREPVARIMAPAIEEAVNRASEAARRRQEDA